MYQRCEEVVPPNISGVQRVTQTRCDATEIKERVPESSIPEISQKLGPPILIALVDPLQIR